jgi:hypothetical protein
MGAAALAAWWLPESRVAASGGKPTSSTVA